MLEKDLCIIKKQLIEKLASITILASDEIITVKDSLGKEINLSLNYNFEEIGFKPGQFVTDSCRDCFLNCSIMALCVGFGKGCQNHPEAEELWFIREDDENIGHYCNFRSDEFRVHNIVLLEDSDVVN